jgi:hypothetical protein
MWHLILFFPVAHLSYILPFSNCSNNLMEYLWTLSPKTHKKGSPLLAIDICNLGEFNLLEIFVES